jgi:hypothetical protein
MVALLSQVKLHVTINTVVLSSTIIMEYDHNSIITLIPKPGRAITSLPNSSFVCKVWGNQNQGNLLGPIKLN